MPTLNQRGQALVAGAVRVEGRDVHRVALRVLGGDLPRGVVLVQLGVADLEDHGLGSHALRLDDAAAVLQVHGLDDLEDVLLLELAALLEAVHLQGAVVADPDQLGVGGLADLLDLVGAVALEVGQAGLVVVADALHLVGAALSHALQLHRVVVLQAYRLHVVVLADAPQLAAVVAADAVDLGGAVLVQVDQQLVDALAAAVVDQLAGHPHDADVDGVEQEEGGRAARAHRQAGDLDLEHDAVVQQQQGGGGGAVLRVVQQAAVDPGVRPQHEVDEQRAVGLQHHVVRAPVQPRVVPPLPVPMVASVERAAEVPPRLLAGHQVRGGVRVEGVVVEGQPPGGGPGQHAGLVRLVVAAQHERGADLGVDDVRGVEEGHVVAPQHFLRHPGDGDGAAVGRQVALHRPQVSHHGVPAAVRQVAGHPGQPAAALPGVPREEEAGEAGVGVECDVGEGGEVVGAEVQHGQLRQRGQQLRVQERQAGVEAEVEAGQRVRPLQRLEADRAQVRHLAQVQALQHRELLKHPALQPLQAVPPEVQRPDGGSVAAEGGRDLRDVVERQLKDGQAEQVCERAVA